MTTEMKEAVREKASRIKEINDELTTINARSEELKTEREQLSNDLVQELQDRGVVQAGEGLRLDGVGFIKLESKAYPKILDLEGYQSWADTEGVELPALTINPITFQAYWKEQLENSKPIPPANLVSCFIKTSVKILK